MRRPTPSERVKGAQAAFEVSERTDDVAAGKRDRNDANTGTDWLRFSSRSESRERIA